MSNNWRYKVPERLFAICKYMIIEGTNKIPLKIENVLNDIEVRDFLTGKPVDIKSESAFRKYDIKILKDLGIMKQITKVGDSAGIKDYYSIEYDVLDRLYSFYCELIRICDNIHYIPSNILMPEEEHPSNVPIVITPNLPSQIYFNIPSQVEPHKFQSNSFMDKYDWILEDWDVIESKLRKRILNIPQLIEILNFDKQIDVHHTNLSNLIQEKNFLGPVINRSTNQDILWFLSFIEQNYPDSKHKILEEKLIVAKLAFGSRDFGEFLRHYPEFIVSEEFEHKLAELKFDDILEFLSNFSEDFLCKSTTELSDKFWKLLQTIITRNINLRNLKRFYSRFHTEFPRLFENLLEQLDFCGLIQRETDVGWVILFYWEVLYKNKPLFAKYFDLRSLLEKFDELYGDQWSKTLNNKDLFQVERNFQDIRNMIQFLETVDRTLLKDFLTTTRVTQFLEMCRNHFKLTLYLLKIIKHNGIKLSVLNINAFFKTEINQFKGELDGWTIQEIVQVFEDELTEEFISHLFHIYLYEKQNLQKEEQTLSNFTFKLNQLRIKFPNYDFSDLIELPILTEWIRAENKLYDIFELLRQIKEINSAWIKQLLPETLLRSKIAKCFEILSDLEESNSPFDQNVFDYWGWLEFFEELFPNEMGKYEIFSELNMVLDIHFPIHIYYEILKTFHKQFSSNLIKLPKLRILKENLIYNLKRFYFPFLKDYITLILDIIQVQKSLDYENFKKFSHYLLVLKIP